MSRSPLALTAPLLPLLALSFAAPALAAPASNVVTTEQVRAQLVSETTGYVAGEPLQLALRLQPQPQWHTYWRNPGDSGLETRIDWQLPAGASAAPISWPLPKKFEEAGLVSFGFEGDTWLLVEVATPADARGPLSLTARARWLACREVCIPGEGRFTLVLPPQQHATPGPLAAQFNAARQRQPVEVDWPARFSAVDGELRIELRPPADALGEEIELFVVQPQLVDYGKPAALQRDGKTLSIEQPLSPYFRQLPTTIDLVLSNGERGYALRANAIQWQ